MKARIRLLRNIKGIFTKGESPMVEIKGDGPYRDSRNITMPSRHGNKPETVFLFTDEFELIDP